MKIGQVFNGLGEKIKTKIGEIVPKTASQEIVEKYIPQDNGNKLSKAMSGLASNAKAMIAIRKEKFAQKVSQDTKAFEKGQKFRQQALMAESQMFGLNKIQAKNATDALMRATGEFSYKDASKSAEILQDAPLPQSVFKQELLLKRAQKN